MAVPSYYKCPKCSAQFVFRFSLRTHMTQVHGVKGF